MPVHLHCLRLFFPISHDCLCCSKANDSLAQCKCSFSWTRPMAAVKLSSSHPLLHLYSCLFVLHSLTSCPVFALPAKQPPPPCSAVPRGEEQTPIITQVSVKWIIGWLIELLDGKHPSWVVRLSVLRLLPHLSADARGWHAHVHCQRWESKAVVCSLCVLWQTSCHKDMCSSKTPVQKWAGLRNMMMQHCLMRCNLRLFCTKLQAVHKSLQPATNYIGTNIMALEAIIDY